MLLNCVLQDIKFKHDWLDERKKVANCFTVFCRGKNFSAFSLFDDRKKESKNEKKKKKQKKESVEKRCVYPEGDLLIVELS